MKAPKIIVKKGQYVIAGTRAAYHTGLTVGNRYRLVDSFRAGDRFVSIINDRGSQEDAFAYRFRLPGQSGQATLATAKG